MKKALLTSLAVTLMGAWGLYAQEQAPAQPPAAPPSAEAAPAPLTVSGCVARADEAFKLTSAKAVPADSEQKVASEYTLVPGTGVELAPHVSHQVEVTGTATAGDAPSLTVTALKMTADKCQ